MSMFIYEGGGGVKNGQNLVYVVKVCPLSEISSLSVADVSKYEMNYIQLYQGFKKS